MWLNVRFVCYLWHDVVCVIALCVVSACGCARAVVNVCVLFPNVCVLFIIYCVILQDLLLVCALCLRVIGCVFGSCVCVLRL